MEEADYLNLELIRLKLSTGRGLEDKKIKLQVVSYNEDPTQHPIYSDLRKLQTGTCFKVPVDTTLSQITVNIIKDGNDYRTVLGSGVIEDISKLARIVFDKNQTYLSSYIYDTSTNNKKIAKLHFKVEFRRLFSDNIINKSINNSSSSNNDQIVLPNFRFKKLAKRLRY